MTPRIDLRRRLRAKRRALTLTHRRHAARAVTRDARVHRLLGTRRRIACYLANDGELDPAPLMQWLHRSDRHCHLPVLPPHRNGPMRFAPYTPGAPMTPNRFGISEPDVPASRLITAAELDLVLMPLVGFDADGNRLGMGGGFYDRTLAFLGHRYRWRRPLLIGLAYECQRVPALEVRHWDIPLDGVITEAGLQRFR